MEPMKNHYLEIPEERKLRIFREEDERFYSFWERMLDEKQSFYKQPLKRMKGDAWDSLQAFFYCFRIRTTSGLAGLYKKSARVTE